MAASAIVIGSGPNGLSAAIVLARAGLDVEVREAAPVAGGATRSAELTLPGFLHDCGSAIQPMALTSPFFSSLPLSKFGMEWIQPPVALAHPFDDGTAVLVEREIGATSAQLGRDAAAYRGLFEPLAMNWRALASEVLRPLRFPCRPLLLAQFGVQAIQSCRLLAETLFRQKRAPAVFAGSCAHSAMSLGAPLSAAFGMILNTSAHAVGWPVPRGGSQQIARALIRALESYGGRVIVNSPVEHLDDLRPADLVLCDVTPWQFLRLARGKLPRPFHQLLERYEYGPGSYKVDWALREPIPWRARECHRAATVHLGGTLEEIAASEANAANGRPPDRPFVLLTQPSLFDPSRAPAGYHTAWAYCHVPNGWRGSALEQIENQIERFAPGFRDCVLARTAHNTGEMEGWNPNLVGGDVNGGLLNLKQFFLRPTWRQYSTPLKNVFFCSSSTPPGGAVHGMCGYWAATRALKTLSRPR